MQKQPQQPGSDPRKSRPPPPASPRPAPRPRPPRPPPPAGPHVSVASIQVLKLINLGTYEVKQLHVPEVDTNSSDPGNPGTIARNLTSNGGNPVVSSGESASVPKQNRQNQDKRSRETTDQGDAAIKRPKVKEEPQSATEVQANCRAVPLKVGRVTCREVYINGRKGALVTVTWNEESGDGKPTMKTESKDATEPTNVKIEDIQNAQSADVKTEAETDSIDDDAIEDSKTDLAKQRAESIHSAPPILHGAQFGATAATMQQKEPGQKAGFQKEQQQKIRGLAPMATVPHKPCILTARRIVPPAARRSAVENPVAGNTMASAPLGRQTESAFRETSGNSNNQTGAAVKANNKPLFTDIGNSPPEESHLQPAAQHPYGGRSEEGL